MVILRKLQASLFIYLISLSPVWAQWQTSDFTHWQVVGEIKPLQVAQQQYVSLWLEEQTPQKRGSVLLLPDWGELPSAANSINSLRQALPKWGWETGAIIPPPPMASLMQSANSNQLEEPRQQYKQDLQSLLEAAKQTQQEQFGFQVLIAQGVMGAWLVELLAEQQLPAPDGLVLVNAYYPDQQFNQQLAEQIAQLSFPVLDIYADDYNHWQQQARQLRLMTSSKSQKFNYRQTELPATAKTEPNSAKLNKVVYGWFNALGWY